EYFYGFRDLKIYQKLDEKENDLKEVADKYMDVQERESVHQLYSESVNTFVTLIISVTVLGFGAYLITLGELDGIFLAMLLMISLTVFENTTSMAVFPSHLEDSKRAAKRLRQVVGEELPVQDGTTELIVEKAPEIQMKNVSFTYPGEKRR